MSKLYSVIMAGGRGERFWPLSTSKLPKPFIPLLGASSLLQDTVARIQPIVPLERILISIGAEHFEIARKQLPQIPDENFLVEPMGRDTSACLGFCALHLERRDPEAIMLALPADHYVGNADSYINTIQTGLQNLEGSTGIVFGIPPTRPETGYGYILAEKSQTDSRCLARYPIHREAGRGYSSKISGIRRLLLEQRNVSLEESHPRWRFLKSICRKPMPAFAGCARCLAEAIPVRKSALSLRHCPAFPSISASWKRPPV